MVTMPVPRSAYGLGLFVLVAVLLAVILVATSIRTRRGYALTVMALLVAAVYVAGILWNNALVADPTYLARHPFAGLGSGLTVLVDLGLFSIIVIALCAATAIARRWGWLVGVVASMLPMVALMLGGMLPTSPVRYAENVAPFTMALFCPLLVCVAYGLSRRPIVSPVREARQ